MTRRMTNVESVSYITHGRPSSTFTELSYAHIVMTGCSICDVDPILFTHARVII